MVKMVAFKSTYVVDNNDKRSLHIFQQIAQGSKKYGGKTMYNDKIVTTESEGGEKSFDYYAQQILIVPDRMDWSIEYICNLNGIQFKKHRTDDLLSFDSINSRIRKPQKGFRKVEIDSNKFEKLIQHHENNIFYQAMDYYDYHSDKVDTMLKSSCEFSTTTLSIMQNMENLEENSEQLIELSDIPLTVNFDKKTNMPDDCVYFALRKLGFKKVPVYVDDYTYEIGMNLGLF